MFGLTPNNWLWLAFALAMVALLATAVVYDKGGVFSSPGLQQE